MNHKEEEEEERATEYQKEPVFIKVGSTYAIAGAIATQTSQILTFIHAHPINEAFQQVKHKVKPFGYLFLRDIKERFLPNAILWASMNKKIVEGDNEDIMEIKNNQLKLITKRGDNYYYLKNNKLVNFKKQPFQFFIQPQQEGSDPIVIMISTGPQEEGISKRIKDDEGYPEIQYHIDVPMSWKENAWGYLEKKHMLISCQPESMDVKAIDFDDQYIRQFSTQTNCDFKKIDEDIYNFCEKTTNVYKSPIRLPFSTIESPMFVQNTTICFGQLIFVHRNQYATCFPELYQKYPERTLFEQGPRRRWFEETENGPTHVTLFRLIVCRLDLQQHFKATWSIKDQRPLPKALQNQKAIGLHLGVNELNQKVMAMITFETQKNNPTYYSAIHHTTCTLQLETIMRTEDFSDLTIQFS